MTGILNWHREAPRYREEELRHRPAPPAAGAVTGPPGWRAPTGLGTSAVRIRLTAGARP